MATRDGRTWQPLTLGLHLRIAEVTTSEGEHLQRAELHRVVPGGSLRTSEDLPAIEPVWPAEHVEYRDPTTEELAAMGLAPLAVTRA